MIDTAETTPAEIRAAINYLTALLPVEKTETPPVFPGTLPEPPPPPADLDVDTDSEPEYVPAMFEPVSTAPPLPAPAPLPPAIPPPPGPPQAPELDSRGMPWDSRIHASNHSRTINGEWKKKRGVSPDLVAGVEATHVTPAPAPVPVFTAPPPVTVPGFTAPPPPVASAPPVTAVAPLDFRGLMAKISAATAAGKLSVQQVNDALGTVGLNPTEMAQLIGNAPLIASVNAAIDRVIA